MAASEAFKHEPSHNRKVLLNGLVEKSDHLFSEPIQVEPESDLALEVLALFGTPEESFYPDRSPNFLENGVSDDEMWQAYGYMTPMYDKAGKSNVARRKPNGVKKECSSSSFQKHETCTSGVSKTSKYAHNIRNPVSRNMVDAILKEKRNPYPPLNPLPPSNNCGSKGDTNKFSDIDEVLKNDLVLSDTSDSDDDDDSLVPIKRPQEQIKTAVAFPSTVAQPLSSPESLVNENEYTEIPDSSTSTLKPESNRTSENRGSNCVESSTAQSLSEIPNDLLLGGRMDLCSPDLVSAPETSDVKSESIQNEPKVSVPSSVKNESVLAPSRDKNENVCMEASMACPNGSKLKSFIKQAFPNLRNESIVINDIEAKLFVKLELKLANDLIQSCEKPVIKKEEDEISKNIPSSTSETYVKASHSQCPTLNSINNNTHHISDANHESVNLRKNPIKVVETQPINGFNASGTAVVNKAVESTQGTTYPGITAQEHSAEKNVLTVDDSNRNITEQKKRDENAKILKDIFNAQPLPSGMRIPKKAKDNINYEMMSSLNNKFSESNNKMSNDGIFHCESSRYRSSHKHTHRDDSDDDSCSRRRDRKHRHNYRDSDYYFDDPRCDDRRSSRKSSFSPRQSPSHTSKRKHFKDAATMMDEPPVKMNKKDNPKVNETLKRFMPFGELQKKASDIKHTGDRCEDLRKKLLYYMQSVCYFGVCADINYRTNKPAVDRHDGLIRGTIELLKSTKQFIQAFKRKTPDEVFEQKFQLLHHWASAFLHYQRWLYNFEELEKLSKVFHENEAQLIKKSPQATSDCSQRSTPPGELPSPASITSSNGSVASLNGLSDRIFNICRSYVKFGDLNIYAQLNWSLARNLILKSKVVGEFAEEIRKQRCYELSLSAPTEEFYTHILTGINLIESQHNL